MEKAPEPLIMMAKATANVKRGYSMPSPFWGPDQFTKNPKWRRTIATATTMLQAMPKEATRPRSPRSKPMPPKDSAQMARKANGAGSGITSAKKSSEESASRPTAVKAESWARLRGQGIWPSGSEGSRPRAMTSKRPPGQRNPAIFAMAWGRRAAGKTWSVLASKTKLKVRRQVEGGSSRLAARYSTAVAGKRLREARLAVSEISKTGVPDTQAAT